MFIIGSVVCAQCYKIPTHSAKSTTHQLTKCTTHYITTSIAHCVMTGRATVTHYLPQLLDL